MLPRNQLLETTRVEVPNAETSTDIPAPGETPGRISGPGSRQLRANYDAIIEEQGIYYPVAYRFLKELGRGRQGIVFLGLRQGARGCITRHAIKLFDPSIYSNAKKYWTDMGRIALQTSRLQTVRSPNLVSRDIYDESNGIGYLQMEAVDGIDLRCFLDGRHLEVAKRNSTPAEWARFMDVIFRTESGTLAIQPGVALYIMRQALRGLETLHEMGFVHSDVKPANIMIDRLGYVKLVDFGRAVKINEKMTFLLGSPLYMAPETHRREPNLIQSDLYSVGLVGLEMLRGNTYMDTTAITEADLLNFKMQLPDRLPDLLPDHVKKNKEFLALMRRFLMPDPARRYSNAEAAESGSEGLRIVHKQLTQLGKDTEYGRELENYLAKLVDAKSGNIERECFCR
jgi:serine/threonine protein kinase